MKEVNISTGYSNHTQRNNEIDPHNTCGPTNFAQALKYAGWVVNDTTVPRFTQIDDKLTYFTRTNKDVLAYYKLHYRNLYENWWREAQAKAKEQNKEFWQVTCKNSYPPNELHDVMSYAVNLFLGYTAEELKKMQRRPVTRFYNNFDENEVIWSLCKGLPVISSVDPFKSGGGHYITIVGFTTDDDFENPIDYSKINQIDKTKIKQYIIDNTYGRFDFLNKKYSAVSGNDEYIDRATFLYIIKPVAHYFTAGAAVAYFNKEV